MTRTRARAAITTAAAAARSALQSPPKKIISYVTDIEGDLSFFQRYLATSKVVCATNVVRSSKYPNEWKSFDVDFRSSKNDDNNMLHFVFGGDLFDHGSGDLRLASSLSQFKRRYPDRVTLLLGNRDLNKLRLLRELNEQHLTLPPDDPRIFVPYWRARKYVTTLPEHLSSLRRAHASALLKSTAPSTSSTSSALSASSHHHDYGPLDFVPKSWRSKSQEDESTADKSTTGAGTAGTAGTGGAAEEVVIDTPVERLKWMLRHTMGSQHAFEKRREELTVLREEEIVRDDDVLESFRQSVEPDGVVRQYLDLTDIMKVHGETLFVHGALTEVNVGTLPPSLEEKEKDEKEEEEEEEQVLFTNAREWSEKLNEWKTLEMDKWWKEWGEGKRLDIREDTPLLPLTPFPLLDYGVHGGCDFKTVVYNTWLDANHHPTQHLSSRVNQFMVENKLARVVAGHQPHGDCPSVLRGDSFYVLMCDTTYCDGVPGDWHSRGTSCLEVVIIEEEKDEEKDKEKVQEKDKEKDEKERSSRCNVRGLHADGQVFDYVVEDYAELGRLLDDGRYVGHPTKEDSYVMWKPGKPFPSNLEYSTLKMKDVRQRLLLEEM